jgi:hypothetical protein
MENNEREQHKTARTLVEKQCGVVLPQNAAL